MSRPRQESNTRTQSPPSVLSPEHAAGVFQIPTAPIPDTSSRSAELAEDRPTDQLSLTNIDAEQLSYLARGSPLRSRILNVGTLNETPAEPPKNQRQAIWHPQSGLFVSPNTTYVPRMEEERGGKPNWSIPRILSDEDLYKAFRPRIVRNSGDLFGRLDLTNTSLSQAICNGTRGFVLEAGIMNSWIRLENALLDLANSLLPKSGVPVISYPRFPYEYGYRDDHLSKDMTLRCAIRSRDAFVELSSLVSFIIALNMDNDGSYEGAFYKLRTRRHDPVHSAWLDQLKQSQVCDFSMNFRVGIVVNPYTCNWARWLYQFALAHVPIWIFWGHHFKRVAAAYEPMEYFLPPDDIISKAVSRSRKNGDLILPSYHFDVTKPPLQQESNTFTHDTDYQDVDLIDPNPRLSPSPSTSGIPSSPTTLPQQGTEQTWAAIDVSLAPSLESSNTAAHSTKALAALEEFFSKRREILERRIVNEDPVERQRRLSREASAKALPSFSRKSTVFEWVDKGNGVYEREQLQSKQARYNWSNFTKNQRRFTSYCNQWDLCPQLPKYSDEFPEGDDPDDSDYDDDGLSEDDSFVPMNPRKSSTLAVPQDGHTTSTLLDVQSTLEDCRIEADDDDDDDDPPLTVADDFNLESFLRDRFGYNMSIKWPDRTENQFEDLEAPPPSSSQNTAPVSKRKGTPPRSDSSSRTRHDASMRYAVPSAPRVSSSSHCDGSKTSGELSASSRRDGAKSKGPVSRPDKGRTKEVDDTEDIVLSLSKALMGLSFSTVKLDAGAEASVINLVNTLARAKGKFIHLPANFDHSPSNPSRLSLASETLELHVLTATPVVYLLRNSGGTLLADPWMITTQDASTVLLVFRKKWPTVAVIAHELTRRGARFNTVKATISQPQPSLLPTTHLGIRLKDFTATSEDYEEYLRRRDNLLRGPKGRAALMHGGIIARIARDITDPGAVLDGPIYGDSVICKYDDLFLVDDQLTETDKNIICGVYLTQTENSPAGNNLVEGAIRQLSWWPQDSLWVSMGCFLGTEWTELAEAFFENRSNILQSKLTIFGVTKWRQALRRANRLTRKIEEGAERYQSEYLMHCYHETLLNPTRF